MDAMINLKSQIFYVLWERLRELEAAEAEGYRVQKSLEATRSILRELPDVSIAKIPAAKKHDDRRLRLN
ncbi:hypothetical protein [Methylocapsa palsarum]|uniref:Uncharacterized protein n=1 Tax=Methylocapsa palsarum TaxID=1612308 RepID=A0A1I3ZHD5_9HYPH|nr:hypothetical protein [Methylocapsa palsarum]SFK43473.1 hypothetical protein SAMN05444581_1082 [Methylocapsa palsarum]